MRLISEDKIVRLLKMKGIKANHCQSCHFEAEESGCLPCEKDLRKNREAEMCCLIAESLGKYTITKGEGDEG